MRHPSSASPIPATMLSPLGPVHGVLMQVAANDIVLSAMANRSACREDDPKFVEFKRSLLVTGGNVTPVLARRLVPDPLNPDVVVLELFSGHRRLAACASLDLLVNVLVVDNVSDLDALRHMSLQNVGRQALAALDAGRSFRRMLDDGWFTNQAELSRHMGVAEADVSTALQLTKLPEDVIAAFGSEDAVQHRHAKLLRDALKKNKEAVLTAATKLKKRQAKLVEKIPPKEVLAILTAVLTPTGSDIAAKAKTVPNATVDAQVLGVRADGMPTSTSEAPATAGEEDHSLPAFSENDGAPAEPEPAEEIPESSHRALSRVQPNHATSTAILRPSKADAIVIDGVEIGRIFIDADGRLVVELEPFAYLPADVLWFITLLVKHLAGAPFLVRASSDQ